MVHLGNGLSKKIAKRQAATNLLNILENLDPEEKKALLNRPEGQVPLSRLFPSPLGSLRCLD